MASDARLLHRRRHHLCANLVRHEDAPAGKHLAHRLDRLLHAAGGPMLERDSSNGDFFGDIVDFFDNAEHLNGEGDWLELESCTDGCQSVPLPKVK